MTTFAQNRATVESFVDIVHGGADKDALARVLAENVVLYSPLGDEPLTGFEAVVSAIQTVHGTSAKLRYSQVFSGVTHHAIAFRLRVEEAGVDGMDYVRVDPDGNIAEITIFWRPLPSGVELQAKLAHGLGMQPWELHTTAGGRR